MLYKALNYKTPFRKTTKGFNQHHGKPNFLPDRFLVFLYHLAFKREVETIHSHSII